MSFLCRRIPLNFYRLSTVTSFSRQIRHPPRLLSFGKMNPAKEAYSGVHPPICFGSVDFSSAVCKIDKDLSLIEKSETSLEDVEVHANNQPISKFYSDHSSVEENPSLSSSTFSKSKNNKRKKIIDLRLESEQTAMDINSPQLEGKSVSDSTSPNNATPFRKKRVPKSHSSQTGTKHDADTYKLDSSEGFHNFEPFDICFSRNGNYESRKGPPYERERTKEGAREGVLRPGMVLLKNYLPLSDQIAIVKTCQTLGKRPGGFYQPGYRYGAKLRLQMMCLGRNWDPEEKYIDQRPFDGCEAPDIPDIFRQLVERAMRDAHALIEKDSRVSNPEDELPSISPDICIVNFYKTSGRLGLHQDRDESPESLKKGLPVVSISVGDSAEFAYGDERNVERTEKVVLESGDVLIFGGESRHIYHGVSSIIPNSAPPRVAALTRLRPGRLNLTFRQY